MPLDQLPEELLLQVARQLPDSATPKHLKNLSLTSRKLRPIAQEALHTTARLAISCGCHPKVNAVVKLLRTLLDRPDLASKIKALRFRAVRKRVERLYAESGFELLAFRDRCISKLEKLGYRPTHAWWRSINNCVESAFGGLLLALLPNLTDLDFWIKDHQRGPPSSECISGMWGSTAPPEAILHGWKSIQHLVTGDTSMLKCGIEFDKLTALDLRTVSIGTVLRLNGPGSLQGAENVTNLALTVSIQFADRPLVEKAEIEFSDLVEALACRALKSLRIQFINDGYHIGDDLSTELNTGYFLAQLRGFQKTLETLSITLETTEDDGELDWLVDMCQHPTPSLRHFTSLKSLTIPQPFIFDGRTAWDAEENCQPNELPPKLERLELLFPHESVEVWAQGFLSENYYHEFHVGGKCVLKKLVLTCREDVGNGIGVSYFTDDVEEIWWTLSTDYGIEIEVHDQQRDVRVNMAVLYEEQGLNVEDSEVDDEDVDEEEWENDDEDVRPSNQPPLTTIDKCVPGIADQTSILAFLRNTARHSFGRTSEQLGVALSWSVERVEKAVVDLCNDGHVEVRSEDAMPTIYFVSASEAMLEHDRAYGLREHKAHAGRFADFPKHPRPEALSLHRIAILGSLRDLHLEKGLTESALNDELLKDAELVMESELIQNAMFQLLDHGFIESRSNPNGAQTVVFKRESHELKEAEFDGSGKYTPQFSSIALSDQVLILNFLRSLRFEGQAPEGLNVRQISEAMDIPISRVTQAGSDLLRDGNVRLNNSLWPQTYVFVRESEEMIRQDRMKEEYLQKSSGWETDDSMPELEEY
jgi:hypothetical protein